MFSFIYGIPPREILEECRAKRIVTIGTATTPEEAAALQDAGVDAIVASGFEAGGHRGSFLRAPEVYCATKAAGRALTEGLRMELHSQNIRCTMISPGAVATELAESSSDEATRKNLREFMKMAIPADSIARAIAYAIEQPADVEIDEIVVRPTAQDF